MARRLQREADLLRWRRDPLAFVYDHWPDVRLYDKQEEIILSVRDNDETVVVAGHQLGKDFISAAVAIWFFTTHHPVRIVTTSVKDDHLRVFFGELGRFLTTAEIPLTRDRGGPLIVNHRDIKKVGSDGNVCPISYLRGMVSEKGEGMAGHHAAYTLFVVDEASGVEDVVFERASTWAKKTLVIGNPYGSGGWFYRADERGDIPRGGDA